MELIIGASMGLMTMVFLIYFTRRISNVYHNVDSNLGRILIGSIIAGCGSGFFFGCILSLLLSCYDLW